MAISKKGKRKITVGERLYLWWIFDEYDQDEFDGVQIKIVAEDQSLAFRYGLQQDDESRKLSVALARDAGKVQLRCPRFEDEQGFLTPSGIRRLIEWVATEPSSKNPRQIVHRWSGKEGLLSQGASRAAFARIRPVLQATAGQLNR